MSYILEALQKSEHARQRGKVPDLSTVPASAGDSRREASGRLQPYILAGFGVTLLAAVLGWWRPWQQPAVPAPVEKAVSTESPRMPQPPTPALREPAASPFPAAPPPASTSAAQQSEPKDEAPARQARRAEPGSAKAADVASPTSSSSVPIARTTRRSAEEGGASPLPPAAVPSPPDGRVRSLHELPPAVRNSLPRLAISGYASAGDAGKRMVVVNDRLVQEGEEAGPGVTVVTVGNDGVVFDFQGHRFRAQQ